MTVVAIVPLLVAVLGLLVWLISSNATVKEIGRWMFVCGLLVTLFAFSQKVVKF